MGGSLRLVRETIVEEFRMAIDECHDIERSGYLHGVDELGDFLGRQLGEARGGGGVVGGRAPRCLKPLRWHCNIIAHGKAPLSGARASMNSRIA